MVEIKQKLSIEWALNEQKRDKSVQGFHLGIKSSIDIFHCRTLKKVIVLLIKDIICENNEPHAQHSSHMI